MCRLSSTLHSKSASVAQLVKLLMWKKWIKVSGASSNPALQAAASSRLAVPSDGLAQLIPQGWSVVPDIDNVPGSWFLSSNSSNNNNNVLDFTRPFQQFDQRRVWIHRRMETQWNISNLLRECLAKEMGFKFGFERYDSWTRSNRKREGVPETGAVHRKCPVTVCFSACWWY